MDSNVYRDLHFSADRLALETVRKLPPDRDTAAFYIKAYKKVLDFLIKEQQRHSEIRRASDGSLIVD